MGNTALGKCFSDLCLGKSHFLRLSTANSRPAKRKTIASGTDLTHPFATINHPRQVIETINSSMTGNIVVYLLAGTYHESLTFGANDSGTNGYNILYQAYSGTQPVLSGGTQITGWTLHDSSKNIWQASITAGFDTRQLYINGV